MCRPLRTVHTSAIAPMGTTQEWHEGRKVTYVWPQDITSPHVHSNNTRFKPITLCGCVHYTLGYSGHSGRAPVTMLQFQYILVFPPGLKIKGIEALLAYTTILCCVNTAFPPLEETLNMSSRMMCNN